MRKLVYFIREWKLTDNYNKKEKRPRGQKIRDRASNRPYDPSEDVLLKNYEKHKEDKVKLKNIKTVLKIVSKANEMTDDHISFVRGLFQSKLREFINCIIFGYLFYYRTGSNIEKKFISLYYMNDNGEKKLSDDLTMCVKLNNDANAPEITLDNLTPHTIVDNDVNNMKIRFKNSTSWFRAISWAKEDQKILPMIIIKFKSEENLLSKSLKTYLERKLNLNFVKPDVFVNEIVNHYPPTDFSFETTDSLDNKPNLNRYLSYIERIVEKY